MSPSSAFPQHVDHSFLAASGITYDGKVSLGLVEGKSKSVYELEELSKKLMVHENIRWTANFCYWVAMRSMYDFIGSFDEATEKRKT